MELMDKRRKEREYPVLQPQSQGRASTDLREGMESQVALPSFLFLPSDLPPPFIWRQSRSLSLSSTGADVSTPLSPFKASIPTCQLPLPPSLDGLLSHPLQGICQVWWVGIGNIKFRLFIRPA